ncbi:hypothetical protein T4B_7275 [Trichinella pseudospiralis]|uniref:Uncharacterized protein n=1 Tax=Trichinella pseudospiralis TaxID=6337 RepID=A0A0V1K8N3_TRIPS|nr:hypothetical protein T4A_14046 [Trichinella pseudospiralis]KRZ12629.1 hypothetical protein T4B_7275 [Trichinella pseudospiralis]KRZ43464.1 hypothetical protein T4C_4601 [Trichinella pseudospiralis]
MRVFCTLLVVYFSRYFEKTLRIDDASNHGECAVDFKFNLCTDIHAYTLISDVRVDVRRIIEYYDAFSMKCCSLRLYIPIKKKERTPRYQCSIREPLRLLILISKLNLATRIRRCDGVI